MESSSRDQFMRQKHPNSPHSCQNCGCDEQEPVQNPLTPAYLVPEDLEIKRQREDDADGKAQEGTKEGHDSVKGREYNGKDDNESHGEDTNQSSNQLLDSLSPGRCGSHANTTNDFKSGHQGPGTMCCQQFVRHSGQKWKLTSVAPCSTG